MCQRVNLLSRPRRTGLTFTASTISGVTPLFLTLLVAPTNVGGPSVNLSVSFSHDRVLGIVISLCRLSTSLLIYVYAAKGPS